MRLHHDFEVRHCDGKYTGGNVDKEMRSHIFGSDIMTMTFGDTMDYLLVSPDYQQGQDYTITQEEAYANKRQHNTTKT